MMIPSNYHVSIASTSQVAGATGHFSHFGRLELGQVLPDIAEARFAEVCDRFPSKDGWCCTLTRVECVGHEVLTNR